MDATLLHMVRRERQTCGWCGLVRRAAWAAPVSMNKNIRKSKEHITAIIYYKK
jgi:hypothetical protein